MISPGPNVPSPQVSLDTRSNAVSAGERQNDISLTSADRLFLGAWWLTMVSLPYYVFASGLPQPADFVLVGLATIPGAVALPQLLRSAAKPIAAALAFTGVVVAVNIAWFALLGELDFIISTAFYVFNATVFAGVVSHGWRLGDRFARTTAHAMTVALGMQVLFSFAFPDRALSGRLTLFFNNPNQLAYYALGAATVVTIIASVRPSLRLQATVAIAGAAWLAFRTYSRAAAIGVVALAFLWLVRRPGIVLGLAGPALLIAGYSDLDADEDVLWQARIAHTMEGDPSDYLEDRGLERVVEYPEYLIFGAGEGQHLRFHALGLELHSSLANVVFSYGVLGLLTFGLLIGRTFLAAPPRAGLLLLPSLFYGLFHNGLRFRMFWIVLAISIVAGALAGDRSVRAKTGS